MIHPEERCGRSSLGTGHISFGKVCLTFRYPLNTASSARVNMRKTSVNRLNQLESET